MVDVRVRFTEFIKARHHIFEHIEIVSIIGFDDAVENSIAREAI